MKSDLMNNIQTEQFCCFYKKQIILSAALENVYLQTPSTPTLFETLYGAPPHHYLWPRRPLVLRFGTIRE